MCWHTAGLVIDMKHNMAETYYGFERTICACDTCKANCRHVSGMISPLDLERWRGEQGEHFDAWCLEHLAASPGAIVMLRGTVTRIPTLVPKRVWRGRCHWLTKDDQCSIHATAPFGCAAFSCTQTTQEGDQRSKYALHAILMDKLTKGPYAQLWERLAARGQTVDGPEEARARMRQEKGGAS